MIKIFFHSSDLDGMCAGAIVKFKYPDAKLIGINYGQNFPFDTLDIKNDIVYMVDFSLQPFSEMVKLVSLIGLNKLIFIDHHKSVIEDANKTMLTNDNITMSFNQVCPGKREIGKGACELTWEYLYPYEKMPFAVSLLGRYDVWDLSNPTTLDFQYGMRLNNTWPDNQELWKQFLRSDDNNETTMLIVDTIKSGETILKYQKQENEKYSKSCAFEVKFEGYNAICINKLLTNSQLFESVYDVTKHDIMISFGLRANGMWTMSFYTTKEGVDVSEIARKYGGGGHKRASGAIFKELPFKIQITQ